MCKGSGAFWVLIMVLLGVAVKRKQDITITIRIETN